MNLGLEGKKVAIAGSSRGMGLAFARQFHEEGAKVWLTGRGRDALKTAASSLDDAPYTTCDLESSAGRALFHDEVSVRWGSVDALILNVGGGSSTFSGLGTPDEEWLRMLTLNFLTHVSLIRLFRGLLARGSQPAVISISSIVGAARIGGPLSYSTAKAALNAFCTTSSAELIQEGIRYNVVSPGHVLTEGNSWSQKIAENPAGVKKRIDDTVPMKRFGSPEEIASFVAFLASNRASFCTGANIRVDGGQTPCV